MAKYSYQLYKEKSKGDVMEYFYRSELEKMTTYQLREICRKEKLMERVSDPLDKEELIRLIFKYRGKHSANYILDYLEEGMGRIQDFISTTDCIIQKESKISFPAKLTVYNGLAVEALDQYQVKSAGTLYPGNMLLVDEKFQIITVFSLKEFKCGEYYLTKSKDIPVKETGKGQYSILYLGEKESEFLYELYWEMPKTIPHSMKMSQIPILDFIVKPLPVSHSPLVIDFGSTNTTAGIYTESGKFKLISALRKENGTITKTSLIPSVIGIKAIVRDRIQYVFGHEAEELGRDNYMDEDLPVFYDMKRYVSDSKRSEKIIAADGHHLNIERETLLKKYMEYIIGEAVQQFKCTFSQIQLLAPVRQKEKFSKLFGDLLKSYKVECALDEGSSVLFYSIYNLIERGKENPGAYKQNKWFKALIIDCGGGTTDLTTGRFMIHNHRVAYNIELNTSYENGDTNFGGNNLTFRILQFLKIRLVENIKQKEKQNFLCSQKDIYRLVDKEGNQMVYEDLEKAYKEAENCIPTKFKEYEEKSVHEYFRIKSNYYYLFELAEKIKKDFFSEDQVYQVELSNKKIDGSVLLDRWKLTYWENKKLSYYPGNLDGILIHYYEIQALMKADVYSLMKKFLDTVFYNGELMKFELIKLSGQSCCVELFKEALKEFIPGKLIQGIRNQRNEQELKLSCIHGALQYMQNKKSGFMNIAHLYEAGALPFQVSAKTHEGIEKVLIHSLQREEKTGFISRFMEGEQLKLYLKDTEGRRLREYWFRHTKEDLDDTTHHKIEETYPGKIKQEDTDNITNGETKYFVWASREEWGFYVYPVVREYDKLCAGTAVFFDFEDDTWEENFFDGQK